jgi:hypothetical protein
MAASEHEDTNMDGSFEHVQEYNLQNLKDNFSSVVFTPLEKDEIEIDNYLSSLFDDENAEKILNDLRTNVALFAVDFKQSTNPFDATVLKQCIGALLTNDLLNDDAKAKLSDFSTNDVVLAEIADVLNLRFSDLDNWTWEAEDGIVRYEGYRSRRISRKGLPNATNQGIPGQPTLLDTQQGIVVRNKITAGRAPRYNDQFNLISRSPRSIKSLRESDRNVL